MEIGITSWAKHNPRRDQKTYTWFKLSNDIGTDPDMFGYDAEEKFLWILILCEASKKSSAEITINVRWLARHSEIKQDKVIETIKRLTDDGFLYDPNQARPHADVDETEYDRALAQTESSTTPILDKNRIDKNRIDKNRIERASERELLNFWNSKNIIEHKETDELLAQISKALKKSKRGHSEVLQAISNYSRVLLNPNAYFNHKWPLVTFLTRENARQFFGENFIESNYLKKKPQNTGQEYMNRMLNAYPGEVVNG